MHIVYVADTVDELIYAKQDWSDLTGDSANTYLTWPLNSKEPAQADGPPRTPMATEDAEWERLGQRSPTHPERWYGTSPALDYSCDTRGTVVTPRGDVVSNPQGVPTMIRSLRGSAGVASRSRRDTASSSFTTWDLRAPP